MSRETAVYRATNGAIQKGYRIIGNKGGTNSGKTYSLLILISHLAAIDESPTVTTVVGQDMPNLKKGAIRQMLEIIDMPLVKWAGQVKINRSDWVFTFPTGSIIEFVSYDNEQDAKSGKRDRLFANEANGITWAIFDQLYARTSEFALLDWNPSAEFWYEENLEGLPECITYKSNYTHNPYCPESIVELIESRANDPKWENWYRVYGLGETGRLEGTIYQNWTTGEFNEDLETYIYGLDFGFSNSQTALVDIGIGQRAYIKELFYQTGYTTSDFIQWMDDNHILKDQIIYADAENPEAIELIQRAGYTVIATSKGKGSVLAGINHCQELDLVIEGTNLEYELNHYTWALDKYGKPMNVPVKKDDHLCDAFRGALFTNSKQTGNYYDDWGA